MATPDPTQPVAPASAPENQYDAMASVFDELLAPESSNQDEDGGATKKVETPAGETPPPAGETPPPAGETPAAKTETPPAGETPPPAGETPPVEEPPEEIDWKARAAELEAKLKAQPPAPETPPAPAAPAPTPPPDEPKLYSPEEEEFIASYEKEWPDVFKGEALKRRAEYHQIVKHIFGEISRVYGPLIERGALAADNVAETAALSVIREAHADYDEKLYSDVHDWVDNKLTGTKQKIAKAIIEEGEPQEVVDLITEFKTSTGRKPKVVADAGINKPAPAAQAVTELSAKAKQAAKAMSVVDSKRTAPTQAAADPDDFDGAWREATGG